MLTLKRLLEMGFEYKTDKNHWYVEKQKFCLFPMNGSWAIGSDFGRIATGVDGVIEIIETEDELKRYISERSIQILLK